MVQARAPVSIAVVLFAIVVGGCLGSEETRERKCARLRDHVVELRVRDVPDADRDAHRQALGNALSGDFTDQCLAMSSPQISCALGATDVVAAVECASATPSR
jgi:hypothetical protein